MTRAKYAVDLPQSILRRFGLNRTTSEIVGAPSVAAAAIVDNDPTSEDPRLSGVVSPYHSPAKGESRDMHRCDGSSAERVATRLLGKAEGGGSIQRPDRIAQ